MTECYEATYKLVKGENLYESVSSDKYFSLYSLVITDKYGTVIANVKRNFVKYAEEDTADFLYIDLDNALQDHNIKDVSVSLSKDGKFIITNDGRHSFSTILEIKEENMVLTKYGKEVFSECSSSAQKYHVPPYNYTDHSFGTDEETPSVMNDLDIL